MKRRTAKKSFSTCQITRTFVRTTGALNLATGSLREDSRETVTEACNTPLFTDTERGRGVCRSCASGWETEGNTFANPAARAAAIG